MLDFYSNLLYECPLCSLALWRGFHISLIFGKVFKLKCILVIMTELFVTPHFLLFRNVAGRNYVALEDLVDISLRSLRDEEKCFFREQVLMNCASRRGILKRGNSYWNGEDEARELGFYVFLNEHKEQLGSIAYDEIVVPYQRVVQLESLIADEKLRDEYACDVRREVAGLKLPGIYLELYSVNQEKELYDGVRLFLSTEYDVKVNVKMLGENVVN